MSQFELERFERSGDRLRVAGRWSDVRGMRFMRPTLTIGDRRVLAVLDHKPWAPEEGRQWIAEFPWDGDPAEVDPTLAELAVAPSVSVPLSSPGVPVDPVKPPAPKPDPLAAEQERSHRYESEIAFLREQVALLSERLAEAERATPAPEPAAEDGRVEELESKLAKARAELDNARDRLNDERERRAATEAAYDQLRIDRDATQLELNRVREELADKQVVLPAEPPSGTVAVGAPPPPPIERPEPAPFVQSLESWIPRFALIVFGICILLLLIGAIKVV